MTERYKFNSATGKIERLSDKELIQALSYEAIDPDVKLNWVIKENKDRLLQELRIKRDFLLSKTDYTQSPDSPMTDDEKNQWKIYRQELRDFPSTLSDVELLNPPWPADPNGWVPTN